MSNRILTRRERKDIEAALVMHRADRDVLNRVLPKVKGEETVDCLTGLIAQVQADIDDLTAQLEGDHWERARTDRASTR